jgi:DNA-directed RNA polymerase subunit RPC12/RpoP
VAEKVIALYDEYYLRCPCGSEQFYILVDDVGDKFTKLLGFRCSECAREVRGEEDADEYAGST